MSVWDQARETWQELVAEFRLIVEAEYAAAVEATGGAMVNARGREKGWDSWGVFRGNRSVLLAYGTEELVEHLTQYPRTTLRAWEAAWYGQGGVQGA